MDPKKQARRNRKFKASVLAGGFKTFSTDIPVIEKPICSIQG